MRLACLVIPFISTALLSSVYADSPATEPSVLPRYQLSVGEELTYVTSGSFNYQGGVLKSGSTNIYDVISQNSDGGWHVIGRLSSWETQGDAPPQPFTQLTAFDLQPNGTAAISPGVSDREGTPGEFPLLPADSTQRNGSWQGDRPYGGHITFKLSPATQPDMIEFTGVRVDPIDRIYQMTFQTSYQFDRARGLLISSTTHDAQGYGFVGTGTDVCTLTSETTKPQNWLDQLSRDCQVYFAAQTKLEAVTDKADLDPTQCDAIFASAKDVLSAARKQIASPEIGDLLDKQIVNLAADEQYTKDEATDRMAVLNKPAPDWTLTDASGAKHSLSDYRGKVVVLDFWYRGCGWCMRAMPEVKKLSTDFAGKPVAVLGMNTDANPADSKFVVDAFGLEYPVLHVEQDLVQQYHVRGFPTVFIIDPQGIIREMDVGYSPTLHDELATKIAALLPAK